MADGIERNDTSPEDFKELFNCRPLDPDLISIYPLKLAFTFHEAVEAQRVDYVRAEMFLQSNVVWKASSSGEQRKRVLSNSQRAYRALYAPLEPLNCTAPNREAPYPNKKVNGVAFLQQNPYHTHLAAHTPQFKAHFHNAQREYKREKQTIERSFYFHCLLEFLATVLPTNISYLIKNESQRQFNQRPGESRLTFATRVYNTLEVWYKIGDASNLAEVEDFNMNHPNPANADNVQQMAKYRLALPRVDENEMVQKVIEGLTDGALKAHIVTQEISQIHGAN